MHKLLQVEAYMAEHLWQTLVTGGTVHATEGLQCNVVTELLCYCKHDPGAKLIHALRNVRMQIELTQAESIAATSDDSKCLTSGLHKLVPVGCAVCELAFSCDPLVTQLS